MTREEREDAIAFFEDVAKRKVNNAKYSKLAIEALKQEPVLDKIRAAIEYVAEEESKLFDKRYAQCLKFVLKIIDEYKAESEEV